MVQHISAVTLAVRDMARSVVFYEKLGFEVVFGSGRASFTSLRAGNAFVNLAASERYQTQWWGRVIFRVDNADAHYQDLVAAGITPEQPTNASWGERYFHVRDPDGHELSFAALLSS